MKYRNIKIISNTNIVLHRNKHIRAFWLFCLFCTNTVMAILLSKFFCCTHWLYL